MRLIKIARLLIGTAWMLSPIFSAHGADAPNSEEVLAEAISKQVNADAAVWLESATGPFLALYEPVRSADSFGAVIILPSLNEQPDNHGVVHHMRTVLPNFGWHTLAIQLPILADTSHTINDYGKNEAAITNRIDAAIKYLSSKGINNFALVGKGVGAAAGANYLDTHPNTAIKAFVGISMENFSGTNNWLNTPVTLKKLTLPILDIIGSQDNDAVITSHKSRTRLAQQSSRNENVIYRQFTMIGADNDYRGASDQVTRRVAGWLKHNNSGDN